MYRIISLLLGLSLPYWSSAEGLPDSLNSSRLDIRFRPEIAARSEEIQVAKPTQALPMHEARDLRFFLNDLHFSGQSVFSQNDLLPMYQHYLGREIGLDVLYRVARELTVLYRNKGFILSRAVVPAQRIKDGQAQIVVIEGFIDKVSIEGAVSARLRERLDRYGQHIISSMPLDVAVLERYLLLADDLPGVSVKAVLSASKDTPGAATLRWRTAFDRYQAYVSADNRASDLVGPYQVMLGQTVNNVLGLNEQFSQTLITTNQVQALLHAALDYRQPINLEGLSVLLHVSASRSQPDERQIGISTVGNSQMLEVGLSQAVYRRRSHNLTWTAGFLVRHNDQELTAAAAQTSGDDTRVVRLGLVWDMADSLKGINLFRLDIKQGLDVLDAKVDGMAQVAEVGFSVIQIHLTRLQSLGSPGWSLLMGVSGQYSAKPLLSGDRFGLGGRDFLRAYDASQESGDQGLALKLEIRRDQSVKLPFVQNVSWYAYYDAGKVVAQEVSSGHFLSAIGTGFRVNFSEDLSGSFALGKGLKATSERADPPDFRVFIGVAQRW